MPDILYIITIAGLLILAGEWLAMITLTGRHSMTRIAISLAVAATVLYAMLRDERRTHLRMAAAAREALVTESQRTRDYKSLWRGTQEYDSCIDGLLDELGDTT